MPKRIIILERIRTSPPSFQVCFWADVPLARQSFYADVNKTSAFKGADATELAALRTGSVAESVETYSTSSALSLAQVQAELESRWAAYQAQINNANSWQRYGTFWDGLAWTAGGVS